MLQKNHYSHPLTIREVEITATEDEYVCADQSNTAEGGQLACSHFVDEHWQRCYYLRMINRYLLW